MGKGVELKAVSRNFFPLWKGKSSRGEGKFNEALWKSVQKQGEFVGLSFLRKVSGDQVVKGLVLIASVRKGRRLNRMMGDDDDEDGEPIKPKPIPVLLMRC